MITFEGPQCMWTNPSKKSRQGSDPRPPIQAMPVFWELMVRQPLPGGKCVCLFVFVCFLFLPLYFGTFYRQRKVLYNLTTKNSLNATILTFWSYGRTQWSRHQNECIPITNMFSRSSCTLSLVSFGEVVCILLSWAEGKISGGMDSRSSSNKAFSFFLCLHVWVARDCWDPSTLPQSLHLKMSVRYSQSSPWY